MDDETSISHLPATELATRIREGKIKASHAVDECLEKIRACDGTLRAFVTVAADSARARALELDEMARRGQFAGPLHGVPVSVKDLLPTAAIRTTRGSKLFENDVPDLDDFIVARLKQAGAVIIGKTNTPEFGFGALCSNEVAGNTANPYAPERTSGGSSGGAAVAVATGMAALSLGTDFGGSVRTPASFCNVVGFRPGPGLIPKLPKRVLWDTLASYGLITRTVGDARLMLNAVSGPDSRDPVSLGRRAIFTEDRRDLSGLSVAMSMDLGIARVSQSVKTCIDHACVLISDAGVTIAHAHPDFAGAQDAFETLRAASVSCEFGPLVDGVTNVSATVRWNVERGSNLTLADVARAETARSRIYLNCVSFFRRFEFLILPAASVLPWRLDVPDVAEIDAKPLRNIIDYLTITYAISLVGLPCISIPCGYSKEGLPIGLQIVAGPGREEQLLAFAHNLESTLGFRHAFPDERPTAA